MQINLEANSSRELKARNYLEKHRIMELLNYLISSLLSYEQDKPREYLISLLEQLRTAKNTVVTFPFFMDHSNIVAKFEMKDSLNRGIILFVQTALNTLGLCAADKVLKDDGHGITLDKFRHEVNKGLRKYVPGTMQNNLLSGSDL
ncbi:EF-hand calcium-binding domain-containing protein 10-like [Saccopteryx leptura]|uniref:EF-hand calcium-binding domain-containing protein 10-like n=1 Tax=Saccopteryx leptura TaxID=249018 RepID=UPI00339D2222